MSWRCERNAEQSTWSHTGLPCTENPNISDILIIGNRVPGNVRCRIAYFCRTQASIYALFTPSQCTIWSVRWVKESLSHAAHTVFHLASRSRRNTRKSGIEYCERMHIYLGSCYCFFSVFLLGSLLVLWLFGNLLVQSAIRLFICDLKWTKRSDICLLCWTKPGAEKWTEILYNIYVFRRKLQITFRFILCEWGNDNDHPKCPCRSFLLFFFDDFQKNDEFPHSLSFARAASRIRKAIGIVTANLNYDAFTKYEYNTRSAFRGCVSLPLLSTSETEICLSMCLYIFAYFAK